MLRASGAFAELRARNREVTGTAALQRGVNMDALLETYASQAKRIGKNRFEVAIPESYLESAWIGDWEASYDIAVRQVRTYLRALPAEQNAAWSAVTGYYAAFFAVRTLLYGVGVGHRSLPRHGVMGGGLYELRIGPVKPSVGTVTLECTGQNGGGSHKAAWKELDALLSLLAAVGGLDMHSLDVVTSTRRLISTPRHVSAFRNSVNYSLDIASKPVKAWTSELSRLRDASDLEAAISSAGSPRDENRIELLLLASMSWTQLLYAEYLDRAVRPDRRRHRARAKAIMADDVGVSAVVARWVDAR